MSSPPPAQVMRMMGPPSSSSSSSSSPHLLELNHVRLVAGHNLSIVDVLKRCEPYRVRNARLWFSALVLVFGSDDDASEAEAVALQGLAVKKLIIVIAVTDPNANIHSASPETGGTVGYQPQ